MPIVFIHGVNSDSISCWTNGNTYWPRMVLDSLPDASIWTVSYDISALPGGSDETIPLYDAANGCLEALNPLRGCHNILLVGHSFGGLIIKKMLCLGKFMSGASWLLEATRGAVFLGTPHAGSDLAAWLRFFKLGTVTTSELNRNNSILRELQSTFTEIVSEHQLRSLAFGETKKFHGVLVVPTDSADPQLPFGRFVSLIGEDHGSICKPKGPRHAVHESLCSFFQELKAPSSVSSAKGLVSKFIGQTHFIHFLDHYFLKAAGIDPDGNPPAELIRVFTLALKIGLMAAEGAAISAVSLAQSHFAQLAIATIRPFLETGLIEQIIDAPTFDEFVDNRLREYPSGTAESLVYHALAKDPSLRWVSTLSVPSDTTTVLKELWLASWNSFEMFLKVNAEISKQLPVGAEQLWSLVPEKLGQKAFISRNVEPSLLDHPTPKTERALSMYISELFFTALIRDLPAPVVVVVDIPSMPRLNQLPTGTRMVSYKKFCARLNENNPRLFSEFSQREILSTLQYRRHGGIEQALQGSLTVKL